VLTLILGGARSGKSRHALRLAAERGGQDVTFIATCVACDEEMAERVRRHQSARPAAWRTLEEPTDLAASVTRGSEDGSRAVIIDCLTLWLSNAMEQDWTDQRVLREAETVASMCREIDANVIVVTNEVGGGIVPENAVARRFRDLQGQVNQVFAALSDEVVLVVAGLPLRLQGFDG